MSEIEFEPFAKIARLKRGVVITEKIDGTNGQICITEDGGFFVGSRTRWITTEDDNFGFAAWATGHREELTAGLGVGRHYGEWWGGKIQRGYGVPKQFSLFNTSRWSDGRQPECCSVVPVLYHGDFTTDAVDDAIYDLACGGSRAAPGFMNPEGVVVFHIAANLYFKRTIKNDEAPKRALAAEGEKT